MTTNYDRWENSISGDGHGSRYVAKARGCGRKWRNRQGRIVEVLPAEEEGLDCDGLPWAAICTEHGSIVAVPTKASGISACVDTTNFCDECRAADRAAALAALRAAYAAQGLDADAEVDGIERMNAGQLRDEITYLSDFQG